MKFVVPAFSGMAPRFSDHLLDDMQASYAANLKVTNGDLRGFRGLKKVTSLPPPAGGKYRKLKKLYKPGTDEFLWWGHVDPLTTILNGPLANDAFDRVYVSVPGQGAVITTWQNLDLNGAAYYPLGVPRPGAPGVVAAPGTEDVRAYVYTYRSAFGEEGMPSDPTIATGSPTGAWQINLPNPATVGYNVVSIDIYRTATGAQSSGDYYRVGTIHGGTTVFFDSMPADQVPLQLPLTSDLYDIAPGDLRGLCLHSSGAMVGYSGNQVCFSEPYLPHAWPSEYRYTIANPIVALATISNGVVALTTGFPTVLSGNHPATVGIVNFTDIEPCVAPRSVVAAENTVLYASPNGLMRISMNGLERLTNQIFTREEWARFVTPDICAVKYGSWYLALMGTATGFALALPPYEPTSVVRMDRYTDVTTVETDERNGDAILMQNTTISMFDYLADRRLATTWTSKEYISPRPVNIGAYQVLFNVNREGDRDRELNDAQFAFNQERFSAGPLDTIGQYAIGGVTPVEDLYVGQYPEPAEEQLRPPPLQPMGGEPLFGEVDKSGLTSLRFTMTADEVVRYSHAVEDEKVHKLPSGFKATRFRFTLDGNAEVQRIVAAETAKECRDA
jgi:hypothetical protein